MIYGIGVDLISIPRITQALARFGERFTRKVFTPGEIAYCQARSRPEYNYALRFAAKEAFSKALGVGLRRHGIRWREVEVVPNALGRPDLVVSGTAAELCATHGITGLFLSLSDEGEFGVAMVVLER